jgi:hypothetical protein
MEIFYPTNTQEWWFGLLFYAVAVGLFLFVIIYFYMREGKDSKSHEEKYDSLLAKVTELSSNSPEAEKVNNLYQKWLCDAQTRVTWRISSFVSVIIGFVFTLFGFAVFGLGYNCLKITVAPPFFFLISSIFCFFMISGILSWISFHTTRPRDQIYLIEAN